MRNFVPGRIRVEFNKGVEAKKRDRALDGCQYRWGEDEKTVIIYVEPGHEASKVKKFHNSYGGIGGIVAKAYRPMIRTAAVA